VFCYCFLIIAERPTVAPVDFWIDAIVKEILMAPNRLAAVAVGSTYKENRVVFMLDKATARGQKKAACKRFTENRTATQLLSDGDGTKSSLPNLRPPRPWRGAPCAGT